MEGIRKERVTSLIKHIAGDFFSREIGLPGVLVSITRVELSSDLQNAKIFVSVFPESKERKIIKMVSGARKDFKEYFRKRARLKFLPSFWFVLDEQAKKQRKVEDLLDSLK